MITPYKHGLLLMRNDRLHERGWRSDQCYKFIFSHTGNGLYEMARGDILIEEGKFLMMNPSEPHRQLHVTDEKFLVELNETLVKNVCVDLGISNTLPDFASISIRHPQLIQWAAFVREFIVHSDSNERSFFLEHSITQLILLLMKHAPGSHQSELSIPSTSAPLSYAVTAIKDSFQEDWTLDELSSLTGLSKYQFAHAFKESFGVSPYSFLQLYRMIKSQEKLVHTNDSILSIPLSSGFKNLSSYNHLFKKLYGKTPSQVRIHHH
ncbi:helix-turn-helix transcriptional regulator [Guptibacillus hwajinpoensis]|uniref:AraC-like DNA-binding protein n=1 Tax=Guptibacillus hwajinpoensis TaxID=208199 RepID=A0ABU0K561_9BACL|nr:AraC family transcriptional regulator [Alkalihalobacillus hemicentroti]MDQ0484498.1 AraC-like DNA-binding protein [Alkalihalobacillus hemicentroti]